MICPLCITEASEFHSEYYVCKTCFTHYYSFENGVATRWNKSVFYKGKKYKCYWVHTIIEFSIVCDGEYVFHANYLPKNITPLNIKEKLPTILVFS